MKDFFPDYLSQNIRPVKLTDDKSKGQVVCSCGCEEFDFNYLFFKFMSSEETKKMTEISERDKEMREKRIGPYKNFVPGNIKFLAGWSIQTFNDKRYWIMYVGDSMKNHNSLEKAMKDPNYVGHVEMSPYDPNKPTDYQYIYAKCKRCGKETMLFDGRYYGYDGVCAHHEQPNKPYRTDGKLKIKKPHCEGAGYKIYVTISSTGKEDLFENADEVITDENWKDAFDWIEIDIECAKCGKKKKVLDLETM